MPNSLPIGSGISRATMVIAIGTGWPARRLRTMMSSASGNCAPNFFWRRLRRNAQHQTEAGPCRRTATAIAGVMSACRERQSRAANSATTPSRDEERKLADADASSPDCSISRLSTDHRQPVVAAAGQPALAAQLHQHALAVGLVLTSACRRRLMFLR